MPDRDAGPLEPDSVTDWAEWGRRQGARWSKEFGGRTQDWRAEAWSWSRPQGRPPAPWWSRLVWGIFNIPLAAAAGVLLLAFAIAAASAALLCGSLLIWLVSGVGGAAFASRRGWPAQIGALLGFGLGPFGVLIARRLPQRGRSP